MQHKIETEKNRHIHRKKRKKKKIKHNKTHSIKNSIKNFNRLSRVHQRYRQTDDRQTTDGSAIAYSERESEFTSAKKLGFKPRVKESVMDEQNGEAKNEEVIDEE